MRERERREKVPPKKVTVTRPHAKYFSMYVFDGILELPSPRNAKKT
jgi:hypothetical protein